MKRMKKREEEKQRKLLGYNLILANLNIILAILQILEKLFK
ncbi:hypothetical protein ACEE94_11895 [Staphylococcus epidermidis]